MREIRTSGCASSEGWRVQWENKPTEAKVRSLVAWIAGRRETEFLKPIDGIILGVMASHRAVTKVNAEVASKMMTPEAEPATEGRRQHGLTHLTEAAIHSGGVEATARWQGHAKQLEKPSSSRREIGGAGKPLDLPPILRQTVKTHFSLKGELSHGIVSQAVHERVQTGRRAAAGAGSIDRRSSAGTGVKSERTAPLAPGIPSGNG